MPLLHGSSTIAATRAKQLAVARRQWLRPILNLGHFPRGCWDESWWDERRIILLVILFVFSPSICMLLKMPSLPASGLWFCCIPSSYMGFSWSNCMADFRSMSISVLLTGTRQGDWMSEPKLVLLEHVGTCLTVNLCHFCSLDKWPVCLELVCCIARGRSRGSRSCSPHQQGRGSLCHWHRSGEKTSPPNRFPLPTHPAIRWEVQELLEPHASHLDTTQLKQGPSEVGLWKRQLLVFPHEDRNFHRIVFGTEWIV